MKIIDLYPFYKGENIEIKSIKTNSKDVKNNDLFVCIKGANIDRHDFIEEAIKNGASAIVVTKDVFLDVPTFKVEDADKELLRLLDIYYDYPQNKLKIIGITGTDGKTTSAKIVQQLIGNDICGYIGTLGIDSKFFKEKTNNTTPSIEKIYEAFSKFIESGIKYVSMEASSEGFYYHRLDHIRFDIGALTNITSEHLNTHKTLENYVNCKKELFINSNKQILNIDDTHYKEIKEVSNNFVTYGYKDSDLKIIDYKLYPNKTDITIRYNNIDYKFTTSLLGKFNVENITLALLIMIELGYNLNDILPKTNNLFVSGRMQVINKGQNYYCIIDYAHTTNAVKNVLEFAKTLDVNRIITVIGQAGGRDQEKRKDVGRTTLELSDYAIFTQDDQRYEKVEDIIKMMLIDTNRTNYEVVLDRKDAIKKAISLAKEKDLLLFLGKGSDEYMAIENRRDYYNEIEEVEKNIQV